MEFKLRLRTREFNYYIILMLRLTAESIAVLLLVQSRVQIMVHTNAGIDYLYH